MSENMLTLARQKLKGLRNIKFESGELNAYCFKEQVDVVVSSLALHHLSDKEKNNMRSKVFNALVKGGIFINADIVISSNIVMQKKYLKKWGEFIMRSFSKQQVQHNHRRYLREDRPVDLFKELTDLKDVGFGHTDILWKYYNFAVYCAVK
jgi:tRNA (cmo5U34)-methyltransferase